MIDPVRPQDTTLGGKKNIYVTQAAAAKQEKSEKIL